MTKQQDLPMNGPGVESTAGDPQLDALAEAYAEARDARIAASGTEIKAKEALADALHAKAGNLPRDQKTGALLYKNSETGVHITLTPSKEKLKVKIKNVDAGEGAEVDAAE